MQKPDLEQVAAVVQLYEELDAKRFGGKCPGCGGKRGQGPNGCCEKCWRDPKPRRPVSD